MLERGRHVLLVLLALSPAASCDPSPRSHARGDGSPTDAPHQDTSPAGHDARASEESAARDLAPPLADPTAPLPLGPEDWSIAEIVADADHPGMYTGVIEISASSPAAAAAEVFWSDWTSKVQEPPFPTVPLGGRRWRMRSFSPGDPWHVRSPGEILRDIAVRYAFVEGGPVSGNSLDRKAFTAPANDLDAGSQPQPDAGAPQDASSQPQPDAGGPINPNVPPIAANAVNVALAAPALVITDTKSYGMKTNVGIYGPLTTILGLRRMYGPNAAVENKIKKQIDTALEGKKGVVALTGYSAQHDLHHLAIFALARNIPDLWNSSWMNANNRKERINTLMEAALYASAWMCSDKTTRKPGPKGNGAYRWDLRGYSYYQRTWNANYRLAGIGTLLTCIPFFGGGAAVKTLLNNYSHTGANSVKGRLISYGLTNCATTYNAIGTGGKTPTVAEFEKASNQFAYYGLQPTQIFQIVKEEGDAGWNNIIESGLDGGKGRLYTKNGKTERRGLMISGAGSLPNKGIRAMAKEFDTSDAGGDRSSMSYVVAGHRTELLYLSVLAATGYLSSNTPGMAAFALRLKRGWLDIEKKNAGGYKSIAKGWTGNSEDWTASLGESKYRISAAFDLRDFVQTMLTSWQPAP